MMGEAREMDAVFLARNCLCRLAFFYVKNLYRLIVPRGYQVVALVIEIQRRHVQLSIGVRISPERLKLDSEKKDVQ